MRNDSSFAALEVHSLVLQKDAPRHKDLDKVQDRYARSLDLKNPKKTGADFAPFVTQATKKLLNGKFVLFIGDSGRSLFLELLQDVCRHDISVAVVRAMYKDMVHLCHVESLVYPFDLQDKGERRFEGDTLLKGFKLHGKGDRNGVGFEEIRILLKEARSSNEKTFLSVNRSTRSLSVDTFW